VTFCLVTDRRRCCPDAATFAAARACLLEQFRRAVDARVNLVQIREHDLEAAELALLVADALTIARRSATRIIVNDRLDVALACEADGVHLRGDSISSEAARRLAPPPFLVGRSVHSVADAAAAGEVDYLIAGTVFRSISKPVATPLLGLDGLQAIVNASEVPVLAIGGITEDRIRDVATTGAAGVAGIGLFIDRLKSAS
jgi:thiamine-phosphate pyrophosphorylase